MCFWIYCMSVSVNLVFELNHKNFKLSECTHFIMCLFDWSKFKAYGFLIVWQIWWVCFASNPIKFIRMSKNKHYCQPYTHTETRTRSHTTPHWHYVFMPIKLPFIVKGLFPKHKNGTHIFRSTALSLYVSGFVNAIIALFTLRLSKWEKAYGQKIDLRWFWRSLSLVFRLHQMLT